jgi:hypothetical protein
MTNMTKPLFNRGDRAYIRNLPHMDPAWVGKPVKVISRRRAFAYKNCGYQYEVQLQETLEAEELAKKFSGVVAYKGAGSPWEDMSEADRRALIVAMKSVMLEINSRSNVPEVDVFAVLHDYELSTEPEVVEQKDEVSARPQGGRTLTEGYQPHGTDEIPTEVPPLVSGVVAPKPTDTTPPAAFAKLTGRWVKTVNKVKVHEVESYFQDAGEVEAGTPALILSNLGCVYKGSSDVALEVAFVRGTHALRRVIREKDVCVIDRDDPLVKEALGGLTACLFKKSEDAHSEMHDEYTRVLVDRVFTLVENGFAEKYLVQWTGSNIIEVQALLYKGWNIRWKDLWKWAINHSGRLFLENDTRIYEVPVGLFIGVARADMFNHELWVCGSDKLACWTVKGTDFKFGDALLTTTAETGQGVTG